MKNKIIETIYGSITLYKTWWGRTIIKWNKSGERFSKRSIVKLIKKWVEVKKREKYGYNIITGKIKYYYWELKYSTHLYSIRPNAIYIGCEIYFEEDILKIAKVLKIKID